MFAPMEGGVKIANMKKSKSNKELKKDALKAKEQALKMKMKEQEALEKLKLKNKALKEKDVLKKKKDEHRQKAALAVLFGKDFKVGLKYVNCSIGFFLLNGILMQDGTINTEFIRFRTLLKQHLWSYIYYLQYHNRNVEPFTMIQTTQVSKSMLAKLVLPDYPNSKKITKQALLEWINNTVQSKTLNIPVLGNLIQQQVAIEAATEEPNVFEAEPEAVEVESPAMTEFEPEITNVELNKDTGDVNVKMNIAVTPNQVEEPLSEVQEVTPEVEETKPVVEALDVNDPPSEVKKADEEDKSNGSTLVEEGATSGVPPKMGGSRSKRGKKSPLKKVAQAKKAKSEKKPQSSEKAAKSEKKPAKTAPSTSRSTSAKHHKGKSL